MRCILLTYLIYMNTHLHNLLLPVSHYLSLLRNRVCSDVFMIQPYYGRWPQFHIILFRRQTCEKPMWWHLGPQRLSRVMSLQALGAQRLPASYWRLGWGQGGLPYKSERSTTLQKPWSQKSSAQTDRVYCHKYPICVTLSLNQTIQMCLVQIRFQLQNESIAFEPKESVVRSLHCFHVVRLWLKNGAEVSRHMDSFGPNKAAVWEKGKFTSSQALIKPQWEFLIKVPRSTKVELKKKGCKKKKKP